MGIWSELGLYEGGGGILKAAPLYMAPMNARQDYRPDMLQDLKLFHVFLCAGISDVARIPSLESEQHETSELF